MHLDLLRNKLIPDPFYRDNEAKLQWIENADWEYRTTVQVTPEMLAHKNIELVFEGLDAYAKVYLNDKLMLTADNMFREWRVDVKSDLKAGANQLRVVFPSPIKAAAEIAANDKWRAQTHTEPKRPTFAKPPMSMAGTGGRALSPAASGVPRAGSLGRGADLRPAHSPARCHRRRSRTSSPRWKSPPRTRWHRDSLGRLRQWHGKRARRLAQRCSFTPGVNHVDLPFDIAKPAAVVSGGIWRATHLQIQRATKVGKQTRGRSHAKTGLRSVVLRREPDQWGRSFEFVVNGIPVFGKGADVIPFDSFPTRVTTAAVSPGPAVGGGRQHEHDPPLGRRLLRNRRVL